MSIARAVALASFLAMAIGTFQPFYLQLYSADIPALRASWTELPYRKLPGFRRLLGEVDSRTPDGARILLWLPYREWDGGYGYGFWRAEYLLAGKMLVPLLDPYRDVLKVEHLDDADWVVCWSACPPPPGFSLTWQSRDGMLWRRAR